MRTEENGPTVVRYKSGLLYQGAFNENKQREGSGIQRWPDGALYDGMWRDDKANGKGKFIHPDGDYY